MTTELTNKHLKREESAQQIKRCILVVMNMVVYMGHIACIHMSPPCIG